MLCAHVMRGFREDYARPNDSFYLTSDVTVPVVTLETSHVGILMARLEGKHRLNGDRKTWQQVPQHSFGHSPILSLLLIAFHVGSDLPGEPLVLSELGLSITCSPLWETERNKK